MAAAVNDWYREGFYIIEPDAGRTAPTGRSGKVDLSVEVGLPTLCSWARTDRIVAVWYRPDCTEALWKQLNAAPDAAAREAPMAPFGSRCPSRTR